MPDLTKFYDPNYCCSAMFTQGETKTLTIRAVKSKVLYLQGKGECRQPVLFFKETGVWKDENAQPILDKYNKPIIKEEVPLVLSAKANKDKMIELYGKDTDQWIGKQITVFSDPNVKVGGRKVGGIRIKAPIRAEKSNVVCPICGKVINASNGMTPTQILDYSELKKGVRACLDCASKM